MPRFGTFAYAVDHVPVGKRAMNHDQNWADENGQPSAGRPPSAVDPFVQRIVDVTTLAGEVDSPEAWREVVSATAALTDVAQTLEILAQAKQTGQQLSQVAKEAERNAHDAVTAATDAMDKIRQLDTLVSRAAEANSDSAWREAHEAAMAHITVVSSQGFSRLVL